MVSRGLWAARLVILVAFLDLFIQFPVVAPYADSLGASGIMVGLIVGAYSATNLAGNLFAGIVLDRWGRKPPVLVGLLATTAALVGYSFAQTADQLLAVRIVHGLTTAVLTPGAFAMVGDAAAADRRGRTMGTSGAIIAVTAVIGPPLAGVTRDQVGFAAVFLGGAILMLITAIVFALFAVETAPASEPTRSPVDEVSGGWLTLWSRPRLVLACLAILTVTIGVGTLVTHLPLVLVASGESAGRTGLAFTIYAAMAMIGMATPLNRLSDLHGRLTPLAGGLATIALGLGLLSIDTSTAVMGAGMAAFGIGFGLVFPAASALVTDAALPAERGAAFGLYYAAYSLGVIVGSTLSGLIADASGALTGAPFLVGAAVALVTATLVYRANARPVPHQIRPS